MHFVGTCSLASLLVKNGSPARCNLGIFSLYLGMYRGFSPLYDLGITNPILMDRTLAPFPGRYVSW